MRLDLSSIYRVSRLHHGINPAEIDRVQKECGLAFPPGYVECVSELGYGSISHIFDILDPATCVQNTLTQRSIVQQPDFPVDVVRVLKSGWILGRAVGELEIVYSPADATIRAIDDLDSVSALGTDFLEVAGDLVGRHQTGRLVFQPFRGQQRFVFTRSEAKRPEDFDEHYERLVESFLRLAKHNHFEQHADRDESTRYSSFYYRDFGGSICLWRGSGGVSLTLGQDIGAVHPTLDDVLTTVAAFGYEPRPHPHD